jgi:RNA polymerase subunit RPABC4/transcription elongation factor Spt4
VSPIDYLCRACGASFEVGVGSLLTDDYQPGCPACESGEVQTDWDAVATRFGSQTDAVAEPPAAVTAPARID